MARRGVTLHVPVSLIYDDTLTNASDSERDFYRMLEEAEQAGFMERTLVDITYGEPVERISFEPEPEEDK